MVIKAELADGTVLEFPDGTSTNVIQSTVKRLMNQGQSQGVDIDVPTESNLQQEQQRAELFRNSQPSNLDQVVGGLETGASILTGAIAEPIAGVAGIASGVFGDLGDAVNAINTTKESLTYKPRSDESKAQLQAIGKAIKPVADAFKTTENFLGETVLDATGSPELAAVAYALPTAVLEAIGVKGLKSTKSPISSQKLSTNIAEAITQAAPDIDTIRTAKTAAYNELDNFGVRVSPVAYDKFANKLQSRLVKEGIDKTLTPKSSAVLERIVSDKGSSKSLTELDTIRKIARSAANDIDKTEQRLGNIIINELDRGVDTLSNEIGGKFKEARDLAQRGFRSQAVTDMIENASHTASGLENGLRIEARKILKNPKKRKGFSKGQISALKQIEQGTTAANMAKFFGKFGISEGQATSMLGASIGLGGGSALGAMFGGPAGAAVGAVTVPVLGQIGKKTAQRITLNNAKFADDLARAGNNAKSITRAYLKNTPARDRSVSDLTDLLLQQGVNPSDIRSLPKSKSATNKLVDDAKFFAEEMLRKATRTGSAILPTTPIEQEQ